MYKFWFGKYKGRLVSDIIKVEPLYVNWCYHNVKLFRLSKDELQYLDKYIESIEEEYDDRNYRPLDNHDDTITDSLYNRNPSRFCGTGYDIEGDDECAPGFSTW